ncbi:hypothetical protein BDZ97DRAFT_1807476 [Flammula alnicola]|nr:hypothetical protein BDZ97DRAFT_1807476 [Flammula alnicola]
MVSYNQWETSLAERVGKLNMSTASRIFEVGASQKLIIFEIGSVVGSDEMQDLINGAAEPGQYGVIYDVKPGLWALSEGSESEEPPFSATWVSDGHIDYDALPQVPLVSPLNLDGVEWRKVHDDFFNSTVGCVLALEIAQEFEEVGMDNATGAYADLGGVVPGGFIFGPHESGHEVDVRVQNNQVVQIKVCWAE